MYTADDRVVASHRAFIYFDDIAFVTDSASSE